MYPLLGGIFMGWSLGANHAANVFGAAVSSRMVKFWTAAIIASAFVILGSVISGRPGIETLKGLTTFSIEEAVISSVAAAITVTIMTVFALPVSTSQAVVGSIIGIGILNGQFNYAGMGKVAACWFGTPVLAAVVSIILYKILAHYYNRLKLNIFESDAIMRMGMIIAGAYGAYALGANNVANVTAVFVGAGLISVFNAALIGGVSIALGILTYSRPVMETVGKNLVKLDPFSALIVVLSLGLSVHFFTILGVPVSTSQAVIGGVLGIGLIKGVDTINRKTLYHILTGWFMTPVVACLFVVLTHFIIHLQYVPNR
ncbi:MAG: inorganic phosphate transporter [Desulfobacteraceae bacterium]|nr:MAG: inorganic phosphate transporter [Desulfobacteraceae bacterium]